MKHGITKSVVVGAAALMAGGLLAGTASAADLVYTPINPSFGGNPGNSSHLLSIAGAQKTATATDITATLSGGSGNGSGSSGTTTSSAALFVAQLQGRLLSALASQVTDAIFGTNPQNSGTVTFGDTTVTFDNTGTSINLTITDPTGVTNISVPKLIISP